jgi:hypothetical protein
LGSHRLPLKKCSDGNPYAHLAGALKLFDKHYKYYQKTLQESRKEWDRNTPICNNK